MTQARQCRNPKFHRTFSANIYARHGAPSMSLEKNPAKSNFSEVVPLIFVVAVLIGCAGLPLHRDADDADSPLGRTPAQPWLVPTRAQLVAQLEGFFDASSGHESRVPFSSSELLNAQLQQNLFDLKQQVGLALDAGLDLSGLEELGLVRGEDGSIALFEPEHPRWFGLEALASSLTSSDTLSVITRALQDQSFTPEDIERLIERASESRPDAAGFSKISRIATSFRELERELNEGGLSPDEQLERIHRVSYETRLMQVQQRQETSRQILQTLDSNQIEELTKASRESSPSSLTFIPQDIEKKRNDMLTAAKTHVLSRQADELMRRAEELRDR